MNEYKVYKRNNLGIYHPLKKTFDTYEAARCFVRKRIRNKVSDYANSSSHHNPSLSDFGYKIVLT